MPTAELTAALLAGGLGTRARAISAHTPKVLLEVRGQPFLYYLLQLLQQAGLRQVVMCTGYKAEDVERRLGPRFGAMELTYSRETSPLGTAGALRLACQRIGGSQLLVLNGDSYCHCDLKQLASAARPDAATLGVVQVPDSGRFGRIEVDAAGRITRFAEKSGSGPGWINAGIYHLPVAWLQEIPPGQRISLEQEVFPRWIERGLWAYRCPGPLLDIGTPESYAQAEAFFAALEARG